MIAMSNQIEVRKNLPSGTIILNRPTSHNALTREMLDGIRTAMEDFQGEKKVHGIILTGAGKSFCSGSDLKAIQEAAEQPDAFAIWQDDIDSLQALLETMLRCPKPIVVAMNGDAIGLGAALVLAADLVVAAEDAKFSFPESTRGLSNAVGAALLAFRCGVGNASRLIYHGEPISSQEAKAFGLVHFLAPSDLVWAKAQEVITGLGSGAPQSHKQTKQFVNETLGETLFTQLSIAAAHMASARTTDAAREGIAAFVEKRPPKFP
ncbi:MAG: enoyl-CoA hydratase/isomerase family protein [Pirellulaceae bacterium]